MKSAKRTAIIHLALAAAAVALLDYSMDYYDGPAVAVVRCAADETLRPLVTRAYDGRPRKPDCPPGPVYVAVIYDQACGEAPGFLHFWGLRSMRKGSAPRLPCAASLHHLYHNTAANQPELSGMLIMRGIGAVAP